jgi:hypothetical protein
MNHILKMLFSRRQLWRFNVSNRSKYKYPVGVYPFGAVYDSMKPTKKNKYSSTIRWRVMLKEGDKRVTHAYTRTLQEAIDVATIIKSVRCV